MSNSFDLKEYIHTLRPNLGESSLKTYSSILNGIYKKAHSNKEFDIDWFKNVDAVMDVIKDRPVAGRKTALSAVIVLLNGEGTEKYSQLMKADNETIEKGYESQTKTEKQAENWISFDEVKAKWNEEYARIKPILNAKTEPTNNDLWALSKFMMLTVTSGVFFPPRRSEWIDLKLKPEDKNTDNWIDKKSGEFVWNNYKTAKTYGQQRVPYPKEFKTILNKYLKRIGDQTYFIFDTSGQQINKPAFTQTLNRMYGKNISTSMLRHIYLSDLHKHTPPLKQMNEIAEAMGHSVVMGMEYAKKD